MALVTIARDFTTTTVMYLCAKRLCMAFSFGTAAAGDGWLPQSFRQGLQKGNGMLVMISRVVPGPTCAFLSLLVKTGQNCDRRTLRSAFPSQSLHWNF